MPLLLSWNTLSILIVPDSGVPYEACQDYVPIDVYAKAYNASISDIIYDLTFDPKRYLTCTELSSFVWGGRVCGFDKQLRVLCWGVDLKSEREGAT